MAIKKSVSSPKVKKLLKKRVDINFRSTVLWSSLLLLLGAGVFGAGGYVWFSRTANDGEQLFYSMVSRSLEIDSVSRVVTQNESGREESQDYFLTFSPTPAVYTSSKVSQITQSRENSTVATEMIGQKNIDYVRYTEVQVPKSENDPNDYSKILNTWARREANQSEGQEAQFLNEAIFTFIPFGNFDQDQRTKFLKDIKEKKVYELNPGKLTYEGLRPMYTMNVTVNPRQLVTVMKNYSELTGLGNKDMLKPEEFQDQYVFTIRLKIDPISRHLVELSYPGTTRVEKYVGYGVNLPINAPKQTIPIAELQSRISGGQEQ